MKDNRVYITTTLPYTNAKAHIGHALEFIQADVMSRYYRTKVGNENVWLNIGADEHGLKMFQKAKEEGKTPQEYVDALSKNWVEFSDLLQISYNTFYRTSDPSHHKMAQELWKKADKRGDIYKKAYKGLYCIGCEAFKTQKELVDGNCPDHGKPPIEVEEENYFFKLSKYKDDLLTWIKSAQIKSEHKRNELTNFLSELSDISISRVKDKLPWGIEVPGDPEQVMYVWFDALTNYINVLEDPTNFAINRFENNPTEHPGVDRWWPGTQFFGPDNLRFQGAIWQGMLASFGLQHSFNLLNHGMVLAEDGTKMSKSKGNGVDPVEQIEKYGVEAVRYYLIVGLPTFNDSPYKEEELVNLYNANLANNFGNLLNRVIHLANKMEVDLSNFEDIDPELENPSVSSSALFEAAFESDELQEAYEEVNYLANLGNGYITKKQPWGKEISKEEASKVLRSLAYLLTAVIRLYEPLLPDSMSKARKMLEDQESGILFEKLELKK